MREVQRKNYSEDFRIKVLAVYFDSEESVLMIARRFGVNRDTVASWVRRHHQSENEIKRATFASSKRISMSKKKEKSEAEQADLRLKSLKAELEHERMRSIVLEKMIDVAERELHVNIRKKYGAKQSKR